MDSVQLVIDALVRSGWRREEALDMTINDVIELIELDMHLHLTQWNDE